MDIVHIAIATLCCAGILYSNYRLEVPALETAIPAAILSGVAKVTWWIAGRSSAEMACIVRQADGLLCVVASIITIAGIAVRDEETFSRFMSEMQLKYLPLLLINLSATAIAVRVGKSVVIPIANTQIDLEYSEDRISNILILSIMTATVGLVSVSKLRRSYTSWPQYIFFALAAALLSNRDLTRRYGRRWMTVYDAAPYGLALQTVDSVDIPSSESESSEDTYDKYSPNQKNIFVRILFVTVALLSTWIAHMAYNFSAEIYEPTVEVQPILDRAYVPQTELEIVISMYQEPIDRVARVISKLKSMPNIRDPLVHIYTKDDNPNIELILHGTGANKVTPLSNVGREGETYLYHILNSWDTLAKHTLFLQADIHNPREFLPRVRDYFDPELTGMLSLGWAGHVCNCEDCGDRFHVRDTTHLFPRISDRVNKATTCDHVLLSYKGQFIASAKRIRGVDKSVYRDLHEAFTNPGSWAHQEEYLQGRPDSLEKPEFGYTMERMWNLLLQCNSMRVAWECPSLISGNRIGGGKEDCQCFDSVS